MAGNEGDWASETADKLEQLVDKVRSQTTDRLVSIARIVVFGLLAGSWVSWPPFSGSPPPSTSSTR